MLEHGPAAGADTQLALKCALMKDAIRVCRATSDGPAREQRGIRRLAEMLDLDDEKVRFIEDACEQDEKILDGKLSDSQIAVAAKELAGPSGGRRRAARRHLPERQCHRPQRRRHRFGTRGARNGWLAGPVRHGDGHRRGHHRRRNRRTRACDGFWVDPSGTGCRSGS